MRYCVLYGFSILCTVTADLAINHHPLSNHSWHIQEMCFSFAACYFTKTILSPRFANYFFPNQRAAINSSTKVQWDIRVVSLLYSTFICSATVWVLLNDRERVAMTSTYQRLWGYSKNVGFISRISIGYYLWDFLVIVQNLRTLGKGMLVHSICTLVLLTVTYVRVLCQSASIHN